MDEVSGVDRPSARRSWEALGAGSRLVIEAAELWWVELGFRAPVQTAVGTHSARSLALVRLRCRRSGDGSVVEGWGECAALADTTYDTEDVTAAWNTLEHVLLPGLLALAGGQGGSLPTIGTVADLATSAPARPLAFAALEMAVGDAHLRASGRSFADVIGVGGSTVEPGAVIGMHASTDQLVETVAELASQGYVRVKLKISPGTELATLQALTDWASAAPQPVPNFQVDANGAYGAEDIERLVALDRFGLLCIEQPFKRADLESHRHLAAQMTTPICLDESLDGPASVVAAVTTGACSVVCVKPARLGGIARALEVIEWCTAHDVRWWIGGMFESGFARRVNTALAGLPGSSLPGDLAPPSTYLVRDLVGGVVGGRESTNGRLTVHVSDVAGMGPVPDLGAMEGHVVRRFSLAATMS